MREARQMPFLVVHPVLAIPGRSCCYHSTALLSNAGSLRKEICELLKKFRAAGGIGFNAH
jgi:hypothetical protein